MTDSNVPAADQIRSIIQRVERLHEQRTELGAEIADVFKEGKGSGLDVAALKEVIRIRRMDKADRQEREALVDLYRAALGID